MTIKAIETSYKGYRFRSRLEARWAVFFDAMGIEWQYETEGFELSRCRYLPDFWLPKAEVFIEVKPGEDYVPPKWIYVAGKVTGSWRDELSLQGHCMAGPDIHKKHSSGIHLSNGDYDSSEVVESCLTGIHMAQCIFAWIDTLDTFATLAEIGYASASRKAVYIGVDERLKNSLMKSATPFVIDAVGAVSDDEGNLRRHDLWFIEEMATKFGWFSEVQEAFDCMIGSITFDQEKCLELSVAKKCAAIVHGDPLECLTDDKCNTFWKGSITGRSGRLCHVLGLNFSDLEKAKQCGISARSARFEHGENGAK